ncbi:hypothetical protein JNK13_07525 [bacterium]|nr:hypothetical protein [bacterium]
MSHANKTSITKYALAFILLLFPLLTFADTGFRFFTDRGFVEFAAQDHWPVIKMQSKFPIAKAAFQIPNLKEQDTENITVIVYTFYERGSKEAADSFKKIGTEFTAQQLTEEIFQEWKIYRQKDVQAGITYTVLDAKRNFDAADAGVRLAWPRFNSNSSDYDQTMEKTFHEALQSVKVHTGPYVPAVNETIRRPK